MRERPGLVTAARDLLVQPSPQVRWRGRDQEPVESFSDGVFAIAITLGDRAAPT